MTPEHKALVARLRHGTHDADRAEAAAAIEALAAENDGFRRGWEAALERAVAAEIRIQAAEERAEALLAELRAKETEIENLSTMLDENEQQIHALNLALSHSDRFCD